MKISNIGSIKSKVTPDNSVFPWELVNVKPLKLVSEYSEKNNSILMKIFWKLYKATALNGSLAILTNLQWTI